MGIRVDIVSAEAEIWSGEATMVVAPAAEGEVGIQMGHVPFLTRLASGSVRVEIPGADTQHFFVSGGFLEVQPHLVTVLADTALRAADLNEAEIQIAKAEAEAEVRDKCCSFDWALAQARLAESISQLRTIERYRSTGRH